MATPQVPNIFVPDTLADADQVNANFEYVLAHSTSGPNAYNVMNFGATGDGLTDDTVSIQSAINAAETANNGNGAMVYFPAPPGGSYKVSKVVGQTYCLIINQPNQMTIMGDGTCSTINCLTDCDIFYVPASASHGTGMIWMNLQITCSTGNRKPNVSIIGSAINIGGPQGAWGASVGNVSLTDTRFYNITTQGTGFGLKFFAGGGRNVAYGSKFLGDYVGVVLYGHGLKIIGCTENGGTYGIVADGGADPKVVESPFFGCLSILSMNSSGSYKGGTFYLIDGEANFGPPPSTTTQQAFGQITLTGNPTNTNTHDITITGYQVACPESNTSLTGQASADATAINTYFNTMSNFTNPDDFQMVTATSSGPVITITAASDGKWAGISGNRIKYFGTDSATVQAAPETKTNFTGGSDNGLWPGDAADYIGGIATSTGLTIGCGGYLIGGDHAQCNIYTNWVKDGIVFGDQGVSRNAPQFVAIVGGNIGASAKGKSQISTYALDFQNIGQAKVLGVALSPGSQNPGAVVHIPTSSFVTRSIIIADCDFKVNSGNWAIQIDDNTPNVLIHDNEFSLTAGTLGGAGWYIQVDSIVAAPPFGKGGSIIAHDNDGFNPFGFLESVSPGTGTQVFTNNYGMPIKACVVAGGGGGSISVIAFINSDGTTYTGSGLITGTFPMSPGDKMQITGAVTSPVIKVFGN